MGEALQQMIRGSAVLLSMGRRRQPREQGRAKDGKSGVLRTADLDGTGEGIPAMHKYLIHTGQRENAFYLNNRFSPRCRRNFYRAKGRLGRVPGRARSPARATPCGSGAMAPSQSIGE